MNQTLDQNLTMRTLRQRQREERAALILAAALQVFGEKGYHDASIDEIAARAGVAKGTVYLHFASKEALVFALTEQQLVAFSEYVARLMQEPATVRTRLERILLDIYQRIQEKRNQVLLELNNSMGLAKNAIDAREELQARVIAVRGQIAALIEEGKHNGELDASVPTPVLVSTFIGFLSPQTYEELLTSGQISAAELAGYVSRILFQNPSQPS